MVSNIQLQMTSDMCVSLCNVWSSQCSTRCFLYTHCFHSYFFAYSDIMLSEKGRTLTWTDRESELCVAVWDWAVVVMATDRWYCQSIESLFDAACI